MLLWIDTETTGLDPRTDTLLEVALIVTTNDLQTCWEDSWILPFVQDDRPIADVVHKMHAKNNLWHDCASQYEAVGEVGQVLRIADIGKQILSAMRSWTEKGAEPICGSTPSFDRAFLKAWMPEVEAHFNHRHLDVSSIDELAKRVYPEAYALRPRGAGWHRALADIQDSITLLRYYRGAVLK